MYCVSLHPCVKVLFEIESLPNYKNSLLVAQWGLHVGAILFHGIGHNNASISFETSLSCYLSMYYLITMDLKLQRSSNNHMYYFVAPMCQRSI